MLTITVRSYDTEGDECGPERLGARPNLVLVQDALPTDISKDAGVASQVGDDVAV